MSSPESGRCDPARASRDAAGLGGDGAAIGRAVRDPRDLATAGRRHRRVVVASPSQARVSHLAAGRVRRLVGSAASVVVDRRPVRDRRDVLPRRSVPRLRPAGRLRRRRDDVLRRVDLLHLGRDAPVARDDQRRPGCRRRASDGFRVVELRAAPDRLVVERRPARRDAPLQREHVPRDAGRPRRPGVRPARVDTRRRSARRASSCRDTSPTSRSAAAPSGRAHATLEWKIAAVNLLGCIAFGISAIAAFWVPSEGSVVDLAAANLFTAFGGLCFLVGAVLLLPESAAGARANHAPDTRFDSPRRATGEASLRETSPGATG